jgi:hypothetical protein
MKKSYQNYLIEKDQAQHINISTGVRKKEVRWIYKQDDETRGRNQ